MHEAAYKFLAIFASLLILGQALYIRKIAGTFIIPAGLMALAWFFYTFIPLTVLFHVPVNPLSILYIGLCILAFSLSALHFNWKNAFEIYKNKNSNKNSREKLLFDNNFILILFFISAFASVIFTTIETTKAGFSLHSIFTDIKQTSGQYAMLRFQGKLHYGITGILSIFFSYLTPMLGGLLLNHPSSKIRKFFYLGIAFGPSVYFMVIQSTKLAMFYSIGFFIAGLLLDKLYSKRFDLFYWAVVLKVLLFVAIALPFFIISQASRHNMTGIVENTSASLTSLRSYALGATYAFSDYFSFYLGSPSQSKYINDFNSYGRYTFTSIYILFDSSKSFPAGTYYDYYYYKDYLATNIYTIFRGLINDFGSIGTLVFMYFSGLISHFFFYRLLIKENASLSSAVFIITIVFIEGTYLASIFMARFMYLLLIAIAFIFWTNNKLLKKTFGEL